jgi:hypothetical protein
MADRTPHGLRIKLENRADGEEGEAGFGVGQHPLQRLVPVARTPFQTLEGIRQDGLVQAPQPVVWRCVGVLPGQEDDGGK